MCVCVCALVCLFASPGFSTSHTTTHTHTDLALHAPFCPSLALSSRCAPFVFRPLGCCGPSVAAAAADAHPPSPSRRLAPCSSASFSTVAFLLKPCARSATPSHSHRFSFPPFSFFGGTVKLLLVAHATLALPERMSFSITSLGVCMCVCVWEKLRRHFAGARGAARSTPRLLPLPSLARVRASLCARTRGPGRGVVHRLSALRVEVHAIDGR